MKDVEKTELNDHLTHETGSIQEKELQQENRAVGGSSSLNVTQPAGQKERWREYISGYDVAGYHCQAWKCGNV